MRNYAWLAVTVAAGAFAFAPACSSKNKAVTTAGTGGAASSAGPTVASSSSHSSSNSVASSASSTASSSTTTGAGGATGAGGGGPAPACDAVLKTKGACYAVPANCMPDANGNKCCNPFDNTPCDAQKGEACDTPDGKNTSFYCFAPPPNNTGKLCDTCSYDKGPACAPGMTCAGQCVAFCCDDTDCGTGTCAKNDPTAKVGVCLKKM